MFKPTYFDIEELVPRAILKAKGEEYCWALLDPLFLKSLDMFRMDYDASIWLNNWAIGGDRQYCGWRPSLCMEGAVLSSHKKGVAGDMHSGDIDALHKFAAKYAFAHGFTRMESSLYTPSWCHLDRKPTGKTSLHVFKP